MTNNAVIIKRIIKLSILQAQMRRLPSLFPVYLCRCKKARRAYRCSARKPQFTRAIRKTHLRCFPLLRSSFLLMKWRSLRAFLAADFPASTKSAARKPQFTRAIRKTHLRCFPLLRSSFLLMKWRSLRAFLAADFPASTKSAARKARVNCGDILLTSYSYI